MLAPRIPMKSIRGFTLIEIMLVLVLLALSSAAVISTIPTSKNHLAEKTARSAFEKLQLLNEEAVLSGTDYGLRVDEKQSPPQLQFMQLSEKGWQPVERLQFNAHIAIDPRLNVVFKVGGDTWAKDDDRLFSDAPLFDDNMFVEEKKKKALPPQIFILSSGETTPFTLSFSLPEQSSQDAWLVAAQANGNIRLIEPGEERQ
nr:type II secretion system minor pseudopilin GspH [Vibrio tritonius]